MLAGIVTSATSTDLDAAHGLLTTTRRHHPDLPLWVLATDGVAALHPDATIVGVGELTDDLGPAVVDTLPEQEQIVFALPFLLERLVGEVGPVLYLAPGCLMTDRAEEIDALLADRSVVLAAKATPSPRHSATPNLVGLTLGEGQVTSRVIAFGPGSEPVLDRWQRIGVESFYDVQQRVPSDFVNAFLAAIAGRSTTAIAGQRTFMTWTDYAALSSHQAEGITPAVTEVDDLWQLRRQRDGGDQVDWQLLADKVHDSRPLETLVAVVEASVSTHPDLPEGLTPFERFALDVRRSCDPTGSRWGPKDHDAFLDWLFETDPHGITRAAHLYVGTRPDLWESEPGIRVNPPVLRRWLADNGDVEFGMDLLDRRARPGRPAEREDTPPTILGKLRWRAEAAKVFLPGYGTLQARRTEPYPRRRGTLSAPQRKQPVRRPRHYGSSPRGLNMIGCFRSESGLGQAARASLSAVRSLGHDFSVIDTSEEYVSRNAADVGLEAEVFGAAGSVNLVHANADEMLTLSQRVFRHRLAGRFTAAMWFWEPAELPRWSLPAFETVDELWVASDYLVDVFGQYGKVPVTNIGLGVDLPDARSVDRAAFGFDDDELVFLFVYDALSSHGRKNPEKVVEAFIKAFGPSFDDVRLVVKVSNLNKFPASKAKLEQLAATTPVITLIDEYFTRDRVLDLMAAADVYVSLHAAEGFGLTLLEAMALGTPVIATAYSGSMDFTTEANSWLVDYDLMATTEQTGPYPPGSVWASPRVDSAVDFMRAVAADRAAVAAKAERARTDALAATSLDAYAQRLDAQLRRVL
ncbi:MAG: glycosyltransferase [Actinomycetota bacterium]